jgi:hypothetical protein
LAIRLSKNLLPRAPHLDLRYASHSDISGTGPELSLSKNAPGTLKPIALAVTRMKRELVP